LNVSGSWWSPACERCSKTTSSLPAIPLSFKVGKQHVQVPADVAAYGLAGVLGGQHGGSPPFAPRSRRRRPCLQQRVLGLAPSDLGDLVAGRCAALERNEIVRCRHDCRVCGALLRVDLVDPRREPRLGVE
jgi:hypothetical protein